VAAQLTDRFFERLGVPREVVRADLLEIHAAGELAALIRA
jgi:hypothetical protein